MLNKSKEHLQLSQEKYFSHISWAWLAGIRLIWAGITSLLHGIVPAWFPGTAAKTVIDLYHKRLINHPNKQYQDYINNKKP